MSAIASRSCSVTAVVNADPITVTIDARCDGPTMGAVATSGSFEFDLQFVPG
jgi:hypothetical protein